MTKSALGEAVGEEVVEAAIRLCADLKTPVMLLQRARLQHKAGRLDDALEQLNALIGSGEAPSQVQEEAIALERTCSGSRWRSWCPIP